MHSRGRVEKKPNESWMDAMPQCRSFYVVTSVPIIYKKIEIRTEEARVHFRREEKQLSHVSIIQSVYIK